MTGFTGVESTSSSQTIIVDNAGVEVGWIPAPSGGEPWSSSPRLIISKIEEETEDGWVELELPDVYGEWNSPEESDGFTPWKDAFSSGYKPNPEYSAENLENLSAWSSAGGYTIGARVKHSGFIFVCYKDAPQGTAAPGVGYGFWYALPKTIYVPALVGNNPRVHLMTFLTKQITGERWGFRGHNYNGQQSYNWYRRKTYQTNLSI